MSSDLDTNILLLHQLRGANERLVLASLQSHELAEEAQGARARMERSEFRLRLLMNTIAANVWSADSRGRVRFEASPWLALTTLEAGELEAEWSWLEAVHPADRERVRATWSQATTAGTAYECEHRVQLRDGRFAWVHARAAPVPDGLLPVSEWTGMMADITDRKRVEEARERFIGVLGHDLRSPLSAIDMSAQMLEALPLPPEAVSLLRVMVRGSKRMNGMIQDVLDFARGRLGGGIPVVRRRAHFGQVCSDALGELRAGHPKREILFEAHGDLSGAWDSARLEQVVTNLVGNAVAHGSDPVSVTIREDGDEVVLEVHNNNLGDPVPADILPTLFEPFQRGASQGGDGLGLGLYIVSEIVRAHGGTIEGSSSASAGTTFTSRWPRLPGSERI